MLHVCFIVTSPRRCSNPSIVSIVLNRISLPTCLSVLWTFVSIRKIASGSTVRNNRFGGKCILSGRIDFFCSSSLSRVSSSASLGLITWAAFKEFFSRLSLSRQAPHLTFTSLRKVSIKWAGIASIGSQLAHDIWYLSHFAKTSIFVLVPHSSRTASTSYNLPDVFAALLVCHGL